jgi:hypothetical protein
MRRASSDFAAPHPRFDIRYIVLKSTEFQVRNESKKKGRCVPRLVRIDVSFSTSRMAGRSSYGGPQTATLAGSTPSSAPHRGMQSLTNKTTCQVLLHSAHWAGTAARGRVVPVVRPSFHLPGGGVDLRLEQQCTHLVCNQNPNKATQLLLSGAPLRWRC